MILTKTNPMPQHVGPLQNQHHLEMLRDRNLGPCWHGKNPTEICLHVDSLEHSKPPKAVPLLRFCTPNIGSAVMRSILHLTFLHDIDGFQSCLLFSVLERGGLWVLQPGNLFKFCTQGETTGGQQATSLLKIMRFAFMTASQQCWTAILNRPYHGC